MSRRPVMSPAARTRQQRKRLRAELERVTRIVQEKTREALAVLDEPEMGADQGVVLEARIVGDKIVTEAEAHPPRGGGPRATKQ